MACIKHHFGVKLLRSGLSQASRKPYKAPIRKNFRYTMDDTFKPTDIKCLPGSFSSAWQSPSNIAIVKYWGKLPGQLPANPSLSLTLEKCHTETRLEMSRRDTAKEGFDVKIYFGGQEKPSFAPKIEKFFSRIEPYAPYLKDYCFTVRTDNTFPHSSGIASSASGMSALALCLTDFERTCGQTTAGQDFSRRASFYARLGSGSASRSIYGCAAVWGKTPAVENSSDLYAVPVPYDSVHPVFRNMCDTVLLIESGSKSVSSTEGHALMDGHPFARQRFVQAGNNVEALAAILREGDTEAFGHMAEAEALTLHAMMMTGEPYYILFKPFTITAIQAIWAYRRDTGAQVYFTLDAGANVHILYPEAEKDKIRDFIENTLAPACGNCGFIHDNAGPGPGKLD